MEKQTNRRRTKGNTNEEITLTPGETLLIWRRRMGWNQSEAALSFKVSLFTYKLAEYGRGKEFPYKRYNFNLRAHELCLIYRKRAKKTQESVAADLGICKTWLQFMELGKVPCTRLLEYWEKQ